VIIFFISYGILQTSLPHKKHQDASQQVMILCLHHLQFNYHKTVHDFNIPLSVSFLQELDYHQKTCFDEMIVKKLVAYTV